METVFITVHDLSLDARVKYCSESVEDILGYLPREVKGKSCWEFFHPDEIPFARAIHGRGIALDKAAVFSYCRIRHKDGSWIGCECVFTIVYDVLVASTAIYQRGPKARNRALYGAGVRRIFSSTPRDPRYHMLSYLSNKFRDTPQPHAREPRAALFLNRFTRTSTIMFATNGVAQVLGVAPERLVGTSFYYCIARDCLSEAIRCLESAKSNDSIAYLRFQYRNPLQEMAERRSGAMVDGEDADEDDEGGVNISNLPSESSTEMKDVLQPQIDGLKLASNGDRHQSTAPEGKNSGRSSRRGNQRVGTNGSTPGSRSDSDANPQLSSSSSTDRDSNPRDAIFDAPMVSRSDTSITPMEDHDDKPIDIEAVISCTSDGLVVVLRRAHPLIPPALAAVETSNQPNVLFASPWAPEPVMPSGMQQTTMVPSSTFPIMPNPTEAGFMAAIRDIAVFAWSLTGINGSLADFAHGTPVGESQPPAGLPIWDPNAQVGSNDMYNGFSGSTHRPLAGMGDPSTIKEEDGTSSEDEVIWKRVPTMPVFRRPKRRQHCDAFGADGIDGHDGENKDGGRKKPTKPLNSKRRDSR